MAYAAITIAYSWPLVTGLGSLVPSDNGDPLLSIWTLWWNATTTPFTERWWNGPVFMPAPDTLSYSDHRVGLAWIASPLIWSGVSPLAAYNVAFLASFVLSGTAMFVLAFTVTARVDAAFLAGLVFGFHPFRGDHLPHLELLSSYWMPLALAALHRWAATGRGVWLAACAAALTLQAITCGYYFVFGGVLFGLWMLWFASTPSRIRQAWGIPVALIVPLLIVSPVLWHYREAHVALGLSRSIGEIEQLSADVAGFLTAPPRSTLWSWLQAWPSPEGAVFPGVVALLVIAAALWTGRVARASHVETAAAERAGDARVDGWPRWRIVAVVLGAIMLMIATVPIVWGPVRLELGPLRASVTEAYKPFSVAVLLLSLAAAAAPAMRRAWRVRSPLAFYMLATIAMWLFALGPTARIFGHRLLYKAPYAWLMTLPGFGDEFRSPARFAMLASLTMALALALAWVRLGSRWSAGTQRLAGGVVALAILADGWMAPFPVVTPPVAHDVPVAIPTDAVSIDLPMGVFEDAAAMYRATFHGMPIINGVSGYEPPHYGVLHAALDEGQFDVLQEMVPGRALALFVDRTHPAALALDMLGAATKAALVDATDATAVLLRQPIDVPAWAGAAEDRRVPMTAITATEHTDEVEHMRDGDLRTIWATDGTQHGGEAITVELSSASTVSGVVMALERNTTAYPRALTISVSMDGTSWTTMWSGPAARLALRAALADPRELRVHVPFTTANARYVRLEQTGAAPSAAWAIAELAVVR
ncbi:MAG: discoidin domain-containing protein [Acidobacteria bacterium]|nr:discoidin domain-containing protein [Acidobacteriota bacterium]